LTLSPACVAPVVPIVKDVTGIVGAPPPP